MYLSQKTVEVCKLSAPIIAKHSEVVTSKLYENLYEYYPKTKTLFGGTSEKQYKQLKNAITLYTKNIDKISNIDKSTIHNNSEYNVMIKVSLLKAIKDVFCDAATGEIIDAWSEAYDYLDDIVILREESLDASA